MNRLSSDYHESFRKEILNTLFSKNIFTVLDFLRAENRYIERISSLTFPEINAIKKTLVKSFSAKPIDAFQYYQKMLINSILIPTGIPRIDKILNGGIMTGNIYEICGPPSSGKTLFIMNIIKAFLRNDNNIYFLDSRQKLSIKSLKNICNSEFKEKCLYVLNKLLIKRIHNKYELITALYDIKNELDNNANSVRLVIIDSLPAVFLTSSDNIENNNILNHLANILRYLGNKHHIAVLVTNLVTTWAEGDISAVNNVQEIIVCGKYWKNIPNYRIKLKKNIQNIEICLLKTNVIQNQKHCTVEISEFSK